MMVESLIVKSQPIRRYIMYIVRMCICNCIWLLLTIALLLWGFSESGFYGDGIFRLKSLNESCGTRLCNPGLYCINSTCQILERNITWVIDECEKSQPVVCPPTTKVVTYFDYIDYPNKYLIPLEGETLLRTIIELDYGACKEVCSRDIDCKAICYYGDKRSCYLRKSRGSLITMDGGHFWTCAVKNI